jgi:hypothetical protein
MIEFIFMLTHNDATVPDALDVLDDIRGRGLRYIGFKDIGQPPETLMRIAELAHEAGLQVMLEVVSTSVEDERRSLQAALEIGVDWVLGGTHPDAGLDILGNAPIRYCPFPGTIIGHPSVLTGEIAEIADHATELTARDGVYGVDLLAYRHHTADPVELTRAVVRATNGPVIVAGSIATIEQIHAVRDAGAWGFTIGGAIFESRLPGGPSIGAQIENVVATASSSALAAPFATPAADGA